MKPSTRLLWHQLRRHRIVVLDGWPVVYNCSCGADWRFA